MHGCFFQANEGKKKRQREMTAVKNASSTDGSKYSIIRAWIDAAGVMCVGGGYGVRLSAMLLYTQHVHVSPNFSFLFSRLAFRFVLAPWELIEW